MQIINVTKKIKHAHYTIDKKLGGHMFQSNTCEIITQNWFLRKRGKEPRREGPGFDSRHSLIVFFSRILTTITKTTTKALNGHLCVYE